MLFLTLPGTPVLYAGDELGMAGGKMDGSKALDPFERLVPGFGLNRDPERTPMQWDNSPNSGFSEATPWLRVAPDAEERNVENQRQDERSILNLYRRLIALRRTNPAIAIGGYSTRAVDGEVLAYERNYCEKGVLVVLNFSDEPKTLSASRTSRRAPNPFKFAQQL